MNLVVLMGRLTRDPEMRYTQDGKSVARYSLAVDRFKKDEADFISCVAFGNAADFAEKYLHKGTKLAITGRIQTGSYTDRDGRKVYTTDVIVSTQEFAESKKAAGNAERSEKQADEKQIDDDGFMYIPEGIEEEIPFAR